MNRKFECANCRHLFTADDSGNVSCPNCKSDNVRPATSNTGTVIGAIALFVVFAVIGWFAGGLFTGEEQAVKDSGNKGTGYVQNPDESAATSNESQNSESEAKPIVDIDIDEPINVAYDSNPVASGEGEATVYSFKAWVDNLPKNAEIKEFQVTADNNENNVVKTAGPDGKFTGVPYSPDNGNYKLFAVLTNGQKSEAKPISGFKLIPAKLAKLTNEEVQSLINSQNYSIMGGAHPQIVASPRLKYTNLQGEHPYKYFEDVFRALSAEEWKSVTVNNLGYDAHNRVNTIEMTIVYP